MQKILKKKKIMTNEQEITELPNEIKLCKNGSFDLGIWGHSPLEVRTF